MEATIAKKQTAFRLSTALIDKLKEEAKRQNRSLNNFVECVLMDFLYKKPNQDTEDAIKEAKNHQYAGTIDMNSFDAFMNSINSIE